ncbi:hypothetical protein ACVWYH_007197 [Bradyrhizobium sp. GM24.11]
MSETTIGCFIRLFFWIAALHHPRHLVGGAACACRHDDLDGFGRFPTGKGRRAQQQGGRSADGFHWNSHEFRPLVLIGFVTPGNLSTHCAD